MRVFIDTGAFCALSIVKDQFNQEAKLINKYLEKESGLFYTSNFILDETYTLIKARSSHLTSIKFMKEIEKSYSFANGCKCLTFLLFCMCSF